MERVPIAKAANEEGTVQGHTYEDCLIVGPATLVSLGDGNVFADCDLPFIQKDYDSALGLMIVQDSPSKYELVFLIDCTFRRCRFDENIDLELLASEAADRTKSRPLEP